MYFSVEEEGVESENLGIFLRKFLIPVKLDFITVFMIFKSRKFNSFPPTSTNELQPGMKRVKNI